jgi:hypothetical protein
MSTPHLRFPARLPGQLPYVATLTFLQRAVQKCLPVDGWSTHGKLFLLIAVGDAVRLELARTESDFCGLNGDGNGGRSIYEY